MECYSPVHIGSGEKYAKSQYVYDSRKNAVYLLNERQWAVFLAEHGLLDAFTRALVKGGSWFSLYNWLERDSGLLGRYGQIGKLIYQLQERQVLGEAIPVESGGKERINDIDGFVRDSEGKYYIPGSSIKGAFRTVILTEIIRNNRGKYGNVWRDVERNSLQRKDIERLEKSLTQPDRNAQGGPAGMVDSYFAGLQVSDAVVKEATPVIVKKLDLGVQAAKEGKDPHGVALYRESLDSPTKASFTIGIDDSPRRMGALGIHTAEELLKCCQKFMDFQYDLLSPVFGTKFYDKEVRDLKRADLLLGGGTGFLSKTLVYALAPDRKAGVEVVKKLWPSTQRRFQEHKHDSDREISPHTLKLTEVNGDTYLMGLCNLKILEEKRC